MEKVDCDSIKEGNKNEKQKSLEVLPTK